MYNRQASIPQSLYTEHLTIINGIKFTPREIDVIACLISGRSIKSIASYLSASPKTIESYVRNIKSKSECNSREEIINFIEKSEQFLAIKNYYGSLLTQSSFENLLRNISHLSNHKNFNCLLVYWADNQALFVNKLKKHLSLTGIKIFIKKMEENQTFLEFTRDFKWQNIAHVIVIDPDANLIKSLIEQSINKLVFSQLFKKVKKNSTGVTYLLLNKENIANILTNISSIKYIDFSNPENYYFSVFSVLERLLPGSNINVLAENFKKQSKMLRTSPKESSKIEKPKLYISINNLKKWRKLLLGAILSLIIFSILFVVSNNNFLQESPIRSNLSIPTDAVILQRPYLIEQIEKKFKIQQGIRIVALVGIGGSGKTTIARLYARSQKVAVVWEINAETKNTLINSFENLAYALLKTGEEKKELQQLQDTKDLDEKEDKLIFFVKEKLRSRSNWLLIYNNVESFTDIQRHLPEDTEIWGKGDVLVTVRDANIASNNFINPQHIIHVEELSKIEASTLFCKIYFNSTPDKLLPTYRKDIDAFIKNIPNFPLDISIAAYYLKSTNISYDNYLDNLKKSSTGFISVQRAILKQAFNYEKTRSDIVVLSLEKLISVHKDFTELLLFICLLGANNIPRDLLDAYKNNTTVDLFIFNLKKFSLITDITALSSQPTSLFSIHPKTQEIVLTHLSQTEGLVKLNIYLSRILLTLENYIENAIQEENIFILNILTNHLQALLNHKNLLSQEARAVINSKLGYITYCLHDYMKDKKVLEKNLSSLNKQHSVNYLTIAEISISLGNIYGILGDYKKAKIHLLRSLMIYEKNYGKNHYKVASIVKDLGQIYLLENKLEEAEHLLLAALEVFYKNNHRITYTCLEKLANLYIKKSTQTTSTAKNQEFKKKAIEYLRKSLDFTKAHFPENSTSRTRIKAKLESFTP